ncbi:MAG: hypothetical protein HYZ53_17945 [Planctomycetes bacterium]|nr:hypothetical protein [Planctomycetota bacterium]
MSCGSPWRSAGRGGVGFAHVTASNPEAVPILLEALKDKEAVARVLNRASPRFDGAAARAAAAALREVAAHDASEGGWGCGCGHRPR